MARSAARPRRCMSAASTPWRGSRSLRPSNSPAQVFVSTSLALVRRKQGCSTALRKRRKTKQTSLRHTFLPNAWDCPKRLQMPSCSSALTRPLTLSVHPWPWMEECSRGDSTSTSDGTSRELPRLEGRMAQHKTALVTGASRGIGRATAAALARAGAHVLVHYGRSAREAESLVSEIQTEGGLANAISADLGTPNGAALLAKQVHSIVGDRLDVVVLNAGISKAATIKDYTVEDFDNLFGTNVRSPFFLVQQLLPLLGDGSNIIVISSIGSHAVVCNPGLDNPSILAYASTKGALETLVKNWAAILGPQGIRVNAVAPGVIDTDMSNFTKTEAGREATLGMQALKRIGKPEDVADVVAFLASDKARWITGASIPVDGGSKL